MNFSSIKSMIIPEGNVVKLDINGVTAWTSGPEMHAITYNLINCTTTSTVTSVEDGGSYNATFRHSSGESYDGSIKVTMGGIDITDDVTTITTRVSISVPSVTADVVISIDWLGNSFSEEEPEEE